MRLLISNDKLHSYLGGSCLAVYGYLNGKGCFDVTEMIMPILPPPNAESKITKLKRFIIMGGLEIGGSNQPPPLKLDLLGHYVADLAGEEDEVNGKKMHNVILTDLISQETTSRTDALGRVISERSNDAYSMADQFISTFSGYIETIILPTPKNSLPCRPLHPVLFKKSRDYHLKSYTTPWEYRIDDKLCVFLPEMIFSYIREYSPMESEAEIVEHLIKLSHWAPVCPDIIPSIPTQQRDIFVIETIPDFVWTIGDKRHLSTIDIDGHKVTVLVVPKFYSTSEFSVITFDPEKNDILCEDGLVDFNL